MKKTFKVLLVIFGAYSKIFAAGDASDTNSIEINFLAESVGLDRTNLQSAVTLYNRMAELEETNRDLSSVTAPKVIIALLRKHGFALSLDGFGAAKVSVPVIQELLAQGITFADTQGKTQLMFAAKKGYETVISALLENFGENHVSRIAALSEVDSEDDDTLFLAAVFYGHEAAFRVLLEGFGNNKAARQTVLQARSRFTANTPLHRAALFGYPSIVNVILDELGATALELANNFGETPLHLAVEDQIEVVRIILDKAGVGIFALLALRDSNGKTPLELAKLYAKPKVVPLIEAHIARLQALVHPIGQLKPHFIPDSNSKSK